MTGQTLDLTAIRERAAAFQVVKDRVFVADGPAKAAASAADVPALLTEMGRLLARLAAAESLTGDTDGNQLDPDTDIPVGKLQRALYDVAW